MKITFAMVACASLMAVNVFAGADTIIRERAKELRDQNNVRQGVPPPTQPARAQAAPAPAAPVQSPALTRLHSDLAAIQANSVPTAAQKQRLAQDLLAIAQGTRPSFATATNWAEGVAAAFAEKPLSATSRARLIQDLDAVLNPGKYPQAKPDGIFADVQAIFQENGLKRSQAVAIANNVRTLAAEVRR